MATPDSPAHEHIVMVPQDGTGQRLDKWLASVLPDVSRSRLKALIEDGSVSVSEVPQTDPAYRIKSGQSIKVNQPEPAEATLAAQDIPLEIVFEDEHLIVVNKPPGLVVHPAPGNPDKTLVNALLAHCGDSLRGIGGTRRPGLVHRIDKDTSGLLVAAKTEQAHAGLAAQFSAHDIERTYDAFVWGVPSPRKGHITGTIGRSPHNRKKMAIVSRGGKPAETSYATVAAFGSATAHVRCTLKTGRTHQIRVHMASRGHPLIGDPLYGANRTKALRHMAAESAAAVKAFSRQALHAATLGFRHPVSGEVLKFEAPLPADMAALEEILAKTR